MSVYEFKLPDLGEGLTEGEVARWLVVVGQEVAEDEPLVEIQTDKTTVEIPSPAAGVVSQILAYEGISQFAWKTLPQSAIIEMTAVKLFAFNMLMTFTVDSPLELLEKQGESPVNEAKPGLRAVS